MYERGRRTACRSFAMFALANELDGCRLGLTVTRRFGGAVVRNRAKRLLREVFRRNRQRLDVPMDLVIHARAPLLDQDAAALERDFLRCFRNVARGPRS